MDRETKLKYAVRAQQNLEGVPRVLRDQIADAAILAAKTRGECSRGHMRRVKELAREV